MAEPLVIFALTGAFAGIAAGLLGVGGGLIVVPALIMYFQHIGLDSAILVHLAIGTSLATIIATGVSSTWAHHRKDAVDWSLLRRLLPGLTVGAIIGVLLADQMPSSMLRKVFGGFEILAALYLALGRPPSAGIRLPGPGGTGIAGIVIGGVSTIVGIGGGTMTVPFLTWCGISIRNAVAASAACGIPIALVGTVVYIAVGWNAAGLPGLTTGFVYWPAFLAIVPISVIAAPVGAWLAHRLPRPLLRLIFAVLLAGLGIRVLISG